MGINSFRATKITAYLKNGGTLEKAGVMVNHASTSMTQLYDRRHDEMRLSELGFASPLNALTEEQIQYREIARVHDM